MNDKQEEHDVSRISFVVSRVKYVERCVLLLCNVRFACVYLLSLVFFVVAVSDFSVVSIGICVLLVYVSPVSGICHRCSVS